jgi:hypothetical protein
MHDLLRLFARGACQQADSPADRDAAEASLASHYVILARCLDSCLNPQRRPAAEQNEPPVRRARPEERSTPSYAALGSNRDQMRKPAARP